MSTTTDPVRDRMAAANPAPENANPPEEVLAAAVLLDVIDERSGEMTPDTKTREKDTGSLPRHPRNWVWALGGGFAVVVLSVGIASLATRGNGRDLGTEPSPNVLHPPATTLVTEPVPTTLATQAPSGLGPWSWTRIDAGDMVGVGLASGPMGTVAMVGNTPSAGSTWFSEGGATWQPLDVPPGGDVAYGDPGFVVCCHQTGHEAATASSFSPDGVTWSTPPIDFDGTEPFLPGTHERMTAVTYGNGIFVAVGQVIEFGTQIEEIRLGVWHSDDGQTWSAVPQAAVIDVEDCCVSDVTFGSSGFMAVGPAGVWHSPDGETWAPVTQMPEDTGVGWVTHLDGGYFAVGSHDVGPDTTRAVILYSTDGISWEIVLENPDWGDIAGVAYGDRGYLAVGWSGDWGAAIWHSTDGVTWTGPNHDPDLFTDAWFHAVGYIDGRYVIFGETNNAWPPHGWLYISE